MDYVRLATIAARVASRGTWFHATRKSLFKSIRKSGLTQKSDPKKWGGHATGKGVYLVQSLDGAANNSLTGRYPGSVSASSIVRIYFLREDGKPYVAWPETETSARRAYRAAEVATMIVCTLTWTEPTKGSHAILFPNEDLEDLLEVAKWVKNKMGDEVGGTVAAMKLSQKKGNPTDDDPWGDLALNVRYASGEELYDEDCPTFTKHGQECA